MVTEKHTPVPFKYRARLTRSETVGQEKGARAHHSMHVSGKVHPEPYNITAATELAQRKVQPFVDLGWYVESLVINAYDAEEA